MASPQASHVVISIDISGSMSGQWLQRAKEGAIKVVDALSPEDSYTMMTFGSRVQVVQNRMLKRNQPISAFIAVVNSLGINGATAFYDAIIDGCEKLHSSIDEKRSLVLLTDGADGGSRHTLAEATKCLHYSNLDNFTFMIIGINLQGSAKSIVEGLCAATHCKMFQAESTDGAAVELSFQKAVGRLLDDTKGRFNAAEGLQLRGRAHSPVMAVCRDTDVMSDNDDAAPSGGSYPSGPVLLQDDSDTEQSDVSDSSDTELEDYVESEPEEERDSPRASSPRASSPRASSPRASSSDSCSDEEQDAGSPAPVQPMESLSISDDGDIPLPSLPACVPVYHNSHVLAADEPDTEPESDSDSD